MIGASPMGRLGAVLPMGRSSPPHPGGPCSPGSGHRPEHVRTSTHGGGGEPQEGRHLAGRRFRHLLRDPGARGIGSDRPQHRHRPRKRGILVRGLHRLAGLDRRDRAREVTPQRRRPMTGTAPRRMPSRASKDAAKYLLDDEESVLSTRRHWAVLIEPTAKFLPAFVVGGWLFLHDPESQLFVIVGLGILAVALGYYWLRVSEWWMRYFIVTKRRVLLTSGVIVRTVTL